MELLAVEKAELAPGVWSLTLRGSIDASNAAKLDAAAAELFATGARNLLIILRYAEYVSSAGFSFFLKVADLAAIKCGKVIFVGSPPPIKEIFNVLGLDEVLAFAPDENSALTFLAP